MKYEYQNSKIEKLCTNFPHAKKELGEAGAKKLKRRTDDLDAAVVITDLIAGNPHPLKGNRHGQFALEVTGSERLILIPAMDPIPKKIDNGIDWAAVNKVMICGIEDYHDNN